MKPDWLDNLYVLRIAACPNEVKASRLPQFVAAWYVELAIMRG